MGDRRAVAEHQKSQPIAASSRPDAGRRSPLPSPHAASVQNRHTGRAVELKAKVVR